MIATVDNDDVAAKVFTLANMLIGLARASGLGPAVAANSLFYALCGAMIAAEMTRAEADELIGGLLQMVFGSEQGRLADLAIAKGTIEHVPTGRA